MHYFCLKFEKKCFIRPHPYPSAPLFQVLDPPLAAADAHCDAAAAAETVVRKQ